MCRCIDCDNDDMQEKLDEENELILDDEDQSGSFRINSKRG